MAEATRSTTRHHDDAQRIEEDRSTKMIEKRTARVPSDAYLFAALGSMAGSAYLQWRGDRELSLFVGQWAPAFLTMGVYNKMVKLLGSD